MTSLMLTGIPVYATENQPAQPAQQQQQQEQQAQQQQAAQQAAQQQAAQQAAEQAAQQQAAQQAAEQQAAQQQAQQQAAQQQAAEQTTQEQTQQTTEQTQQQTTQPAATARPAVRTVVTPAVVQQEEEAEEEGAEGEVEEGGEEFTSEQGEYSLKLIKNANLREEPSTDAASHIIIPFGITISATQKVTNSLGETWYQSEYGGYTGYIRGDMADVTTISVQTDEEGEGEGETEEETSEETQESTSQGVSKRSNYRTTTKKTPVTINRQYNAQTYTSGDVAVEPREKVDLIFILFLGAAAIGCVFTYMMIHSLRSEYKRYRRNKLSKERKN